MLTRRKCSVASRRRCEHEFATSSRRLPTDSIDNLETGQTDCVCVCLTTWILIDTDNFFNSDDIMTPWLKKLSIFIKIGVIKHYAVCLVSFQIVDRIRRQSSSASCELCSHRRRRRDKTVSSCRRCVQCVLGLKSSTIRLSVGVVTDAESLITNDYAMTSLNYTQLSLQVTSDVTEFKSKSDGFLQFSQIRNLTDLKTCVCRIWMQVSLWSDLVFGLYGLSHQLFNAWLFAFKKRV